MNILYKFWIFNVQDGDLCCAVLFSHVLILCDHMGCSLPGSSVHGNFPDEKFQEWVAMSSFGGGAGLPNPGMEARSPALHVDSLSSEPQGKPENTGVGGYPFCRGSY